MEIIIDKLIRSKRKTLAIIINADGKVMVRAPRFTSDHQIHHFINSKKEWITNKIKQMESLQIPEHKYQPGEIFLFLGNEYLLELVNPSKNALLLDGKFLLNKEKQTDAENVFTSWYRKRAREIFNDRVTNLAKQNSFKFNQVRISSARTRWGSCSSTGTLSFTWRLVLAPMEIIEYVIIHELTHTEIKNHSSVFWNKVNELDPDYKRKRKWLRIHGHKLSI